jgi:TPR repeat protein
MGASQSTSAPSTAREGAPFESRKEEAGSSANGSAADNNNNNNSNPNEPLYPVPTGREYEALDRIASELPNVIDDESRQQVEDFRQACNKGKGPMVACFATGEYLSLFERKHREAADLYTNVCSRPLTDKSPNGVEVDGTMAYPPGCFNLAKMKLTGKGTSFEPLEAYRLLDRACRGGHGGACFLQAQLLCTRPDSLGKGIPHDPRKAMQLYRQNCEQLGDSISCYTLAAMLLRGDRVSRQADNVSPQEARGEAEVVVRENEPDRRRRPGDSEPYVVERDPPLAAKLLQQACDAGSHVTSCHNLAVMYLHGDDGVPANEEKAEEYKRKTEEKIHLFGGLR